MNNYEQTGEALKILSRALDLASEWCSKSCFNIHSAKYFKDEFMKEASEEYFKETKQALIDFHIRRTAK